MNCAWFPPSLLVYKVGSPDIASGSNAGGKRGLGALFLNTLVLVLSLRSSRGTQSRRATWTSSLGYAQGSFLNGHCRLWMEEGTHWRLAVCIRPDSRSQKRHWSPSQSPALHRAQSEIKWTWKSTQLMGVRAGTETQPVAPLWCFGLCTLWKWSDCS